MHSGGANLCIPFPLKFKLQTVYLFLEVVGVII